MGCVRAYDRESIKSISLGSPNLTKLNRTTSIICVRVFFMEYDIWLWQDIAYHWGTCFFFKKKLKTTPDFKHHQNKLAQPYLPYLNSQQLRLRSTIGNPQNFQVHWQGICITNRFKLKRTLIFKLGITGMIEQSKTHPFNLSKGVKTFLPRIMKREIKQ